MIDRPARLATVLTMVILAMLPGCVGDSIKLGGLGSSSGDPDEGTVAAGLKEALRVGTERTVESTSVVDGFLANELIRIGLPDELERLANGLRMVGLGREVNELEVSMNRAAERAAGEAKAVFWDAITKMTIADAFEILGGEETAATDYFRLHTSEALRERFRPIVEEKMNEVGFYSVYDQALEAYTALPLASKPELDLEEHVTNRTLDGLFLVLADEEKRIREDPAARTTELLRRVFGGES